MKFIHITMCAFMQFALHTWYSGCQLKRLVFIEWLKFLL